MKGGLTPNRITNPDEFLFNGVLPSEIDITLTDECQAKGSLKYGNITYEYDYEIGKVIVK